MRTNTGNSPTAWRTGQIDPQLTADKGRAQGSRRASRKTRNRRSHFFHDRECVARRDREAGGVQSLGLDIRAGLHTGECEVMGEDLGGIVVHIGARIAALAAPGEVLVSSTVKDLAGSGLSFLDHGAKSLKGVPNEWRLYSVEN